MRGSRRHRQFRFDGIACLGGYYIGQRSENPLLGSHITWDLLMEEWHGERVGEDLVTPKYTLRLSLEEA